MIHADIAVSRPMKMLSPAASSANACCFSSLHSLRRKTRVFVDRRSQQAVCLLYNMPETLALNAIECHYCALSCAHVHMSVWCNT